MFKGTWTRQGQILYLLVRRDIEARYRGSLLGIFWSLLTPLATLLVFTFVFTVVFKARWQLTGNLSGDGATEADVALVIFCGLAIYNFFSEVVGRSPDAIASRANFVKKIIFPLEIIPLTIVCSAMVNLLITLVVIVGASLWLTDGLTWNVLWLPLLLVPLCLSMLGLVFFVSALAVYLKDVGQIVTPLIQLMMFLSPVFYPVAALPESIQAWMYLNPLAFSIELTRGIVLAGSGVDWAAWTGYLAASLVAVALGIAWFRRLRTGFADVV